MAPIIISHRIGASAPASVAATATATATATHLLVMIILLLASSHSTAEDALVSAPAFKQTSLLLGESYKLECPVEQLEGATSLVEWYHNGERINGQYDRYSVTERGVLHIKNAQIDDSGNFTCTALNGFTSASFTIGLLIVSGSGDNYRITPDPPIPQSSHPDGPVFVETSKMRPAIIERSLGSAVELPCRAVGNPTPNITWFRNEQPITASRSNSGRALSAAKQTPRGLKLTDLSVADSGRYACRVRNQHGEIEYVYTLTVKANSQLVPTFTESSTTLLVPQRDSITLRCDTRSEATPEISWLKRRIRANQTTGAVINTPDSTVLSPAGYVLASELPTSIADSTNDGFVYKRILGEGPRYDIPTKVYQSRLTIERVSLRDAGVYLCLAKNEHGTSTLQMHLWVIDDNGTMFNDDPTPVIVATVTRPPSLSQEKSAEEGGASIDVSHLQQQQWISTLQANANAKDGHMSLSTDTVDVQDQSNLMLIVYILAPLLIIIVSLGLVIYYVHAREHTKKKRLRAAVQHHAPGGKSASNSSASLSTRNAAIAGGQTGNVMQLSALNGAPKAHGKHDYTALANGQQPRPTGFPPIAPHAVWAANGSQPAIVNPALVNPVANPNIVAEAQLMIPLIPQYDCSGNHAAAVQYEYYQNNQPNAANCKQTPVHQYANSSCAGCTYDYPIGAPMTANGYAMAAPMFTTNVNTMSTQPSTAYNTHSHNAQSSSSASYSSIRVSPT